MAHKTIAQAVSAWLSLYRDVETETNHIKDGSDKNGLFRSPNRTVRHFLDGCYEVTEYYQFFARQKSVGEADRKDSDEWLEALVYWADDYPLLYEYPELTNGRKITLIEVTGAPYPMEGDARSTLYQISLAVTYQREREVPI